MMKIARNQALRPRQVALLVIGLTLAIFASAIFLVTQNLRRNVREQIINRDGEILNAVALMLQTEQTEESPEIDTPEAQFKVILKSSRLKGVVAIRLFDPEGKWITSFPAYVSEAALRTKDISALGKFRPINYFDANARLGDLFQSDLENQSNGKTAPLLETIIPLHLQNESHLLGAAQFFIDGQSIAAEFAELDRHLLFQASITFLTGSVLIISTLGWAFNRLQRANRLLRERTESLLQANQELALVTKTSAVGVVSTHLVHELKSQLFGLRSILSASLGNGSPRQTAIDAVERMQNLVNQMVEIIRNEQGTALHYEVSLQELAEIIKTRAKPLANVAEVNCDLEIKTPGTLSSRVANLVIIILMNLIENAIQATPRRKGVKVTFSTEDGKILCGVRDEGSGFPVGLQDSLFKPVPSTKEGGSGIGLALSKQLANHLDANLELKETSKNGSLFVLSVP